MKKIKHQDDPRLNVHKAGGPKVVFKTMIHYKPKKPAGDY